MKKPAGIIIVIIMNSLKLALTLMPVIFFMAVAAMPASNEFRQGVEIGMGGSLDAGTLGEMFGSTILLIAAMIALFVAIAKRNYALTVGMLVLQILLSITAPVGLIWAVIMLLIVLIGKKNRQYLKKI